MPERLTDEGLQEIEAQRHSRLKALREEYRRTVPLINEDHYSRELPYQNWLEDAVLQREAEIKALTEERDAARIALGRFQSDKPELGDLSFREQIRQQMIEAYLRLGFEQMEKHGA